MYPEKPSSKIFFAAAFLYYSCLQKAFFFLPKKHPLSSVTSSTSYFTVYGDQMSKEKGVSKMTWHVKLLEPKSDDMDTHTHVNE